MECYKLPIRYVSNDNILKEFIKYIDDGFYICVNIETSAIGIYETWDMFHPILICGYDLENKMFLVNDFFPPEPTYRTIELSSNDVIEGIRRCKRFDYILLYKKKKISFNISEKIPLLRGITIESLNKIINSAFIPYNPYYFKSSMMKGYSAGLSVYEELINDINGYGKRGLHVLYDSKIVTHFCLKILNKYNNLSAKKLEEYYIIVQKTLVLRNMYLKYLVTSDEKIIVRMKNILVTLKDFELTTLVSIIRELEMQ